MITKQQAILGGSKIIHSENDAQRAWIGAIRHKTPIIQCGEWLQINLVDAIIYYRFRNGKEIYNMIG